MPAIGPKEMLAAVRAGDVARVRTILRIDPTLANVAADTGESAVMVALGRYKPEVAAVLIEAGATLSAFELCAAGLEARAVEWFTQHRDALAATSKDGWTALHLASYFGHAALVERLIELGAHVHAASANSLRLTPVQYAVAAGQTACVRVLLARGADVSTPQADGSTPLHEAAMLGDSALVDVLIAHGADPDRPDGLGRRPWQVAAAKRHHALAERLKSS